MKPPGQSSSCLHCSSDGSAHSAGSAVPLRLHAVFACASTPPLSSDRVRKHSAIDQRTWLCGCDCHASVLLRTQCGPTVPSAAYTPPR
jgi:hypothetical protein